MSDGNSVADGGPHTSIVPIATVDASAISDWDDLVLRLGLNPSLSPGWTKIVCASILGAECVPNVLLVRGPGSELIAAVPHYFTRVRMLGVPMRVLDVPSNLVSYHAELPAENPEAALRQLLAQASPWDVLRLANLHSAGKSAQAVREVASSTGGYLQEIRGDCSPFLTLTGSMEALLASKDRKFRYKYRRRQSLLDGATGWDLEWHLDCAGAADLLDQILAIERSSWKADSGIDIAARASEETYHRQLLEFLGARGMLRLCMLRLRGKPVAYSLCCFDGRWFGHLKTSFDHNLAEFSPGALVIDASLRRAFDEGAREFDFLGSAAPHKLAWSSTTREHVDCLLFSRNLKPATIGMLKRIKGRLLGF